MRLKTMLAACIALLVSGAVASIGLAGPPPGKGGAGPADGLLRRQKVAICHKTNSGAYVRIVVAAKAVPAHVRHGDVVAAPGGGCPSATPTATATETATPAPTAASPTATPPAASGTVTVPESGSTPPE